MNWLLRLIKGKKKEATSEVAPEVVEAQASQVLEQEPIVETSQEAPVADITDDEPTIDEPAVEEPIVYRQSSQKGKRGAIIKHGEHSVILLDDSDRMEICKMYASFESIKKIMEWLKNDRRKLISYGGVRSMLNTKRSKLIIEKFRHEFTQGILEEPLSNKRKRLQYLHRFVEKSEKDGEIRDAIDAIDSAREEMEPHKGDVSLQLNQFNMISDDELTEIRARLTNRLNITENKK